MTRKEAINFIEFRLHCLERLNIPGRENIIEMLQLSLAALRDQEERENQQRLTIEQMKSMDCPVWLSCNTFEGTNGYWCICRNGLITCPSGMCVDVELIPNWEFYRYERKGM